MSMIGGESLLMQTADISPARGSSCFPVTIIEPSTITCLSVGKNKVDIREMFCCLLQLVTEAGTC